MFTGTAQEGRKALHKLYAPNNEFGYTAVCDTPTCAYWEVLLDESPDAKVILVERPVEKWQASLEKHVAVSSNHYVLIT